MNRKLTSLAGVFVTVFSFAFSTQVADAQFFAGQQYRELPGYSNDSLSGNYGYGRLVSYNNMQMSSSGYAASGLSAAVMGQSGCSTCANYPAWGTSPYYQNSGCGCASTCRQGCGLFGLFCPQPFAGFYERPWGSCGIGCPNSGMGYPSLGYSGCGIGGGCNSCAPRTCGYARRSCYSCRLSCGYTGAVAACCAPAQSTCCGSVSGGVMSQPGTMAPTVIAPPATLSPAPTPTPNPAPPAEATPAAPPTPGT